ncbi:MULTISPECIES: sulfite exporter TauE/SafE family protein [Paraburkholderia]|uniref:sulfite exporter TauE/SafE family protein n=1 Tax=Paraburkholderia TaxID=1822464 RepID=UPI00036B83FE|nr:MULTISPECIES: sulfite exporter TauE/SafE family protein [Paraburkholderia]MDH6153451.1 putative membrane protein YfcA [Paraburkholderia sp. WSM4179]
MLTSLLLGAIVGAVLGLTGAGGGILAVPALVVGMGWPMQQATPVALIAVAGSAAIGALEAFRQRLVRYRAALFMAAAGVPLTSLGVSLAHALPPRVLLALFATVMLVVAVRMLLQALKQGRSNRPDSPLCVGRVNPDTGRLIWSWTTCAALAAIGALTGLMTGLLGVGGGFVIVPMLRKLTNVSMHGIVATSLMVIALVGSGGVVATVLHGTPLPLDLTLWFSLTTAAGMVGGRLVSHRLSARHVQAGFAVALACVALGLMAKAALDV